MLPYNLSPRAARDIASARNWYDQQKPDLGNRFLDAVLLTIRTIRERPNSFPLAARRTRATLCDPFPYRVYFRPEQGRIVVLAVYHAARDPARWNDPDRQ